MSIDVTARRTLLSDAVAEEIRALMARRRLSGAEMARRLNVSTAWVSYRLTGKQPIDLNELAAFAGVLGVPVVELLPHTAARVPDSGEVAEATRNSPDRADQPSIVPSPRRAPSSGRVIPRRPEGRPAHSTPSLASRRPAPIKSRTRRIPG